MENTGFKFESRIFYFIHLQKEENYERKEMDNAYFKLGLDYKSIYAYV